MSFECPKCKTTFTLTEMKEREINMTPLERVVGSFPEEVQDLLDFKEQGDKIIIRPLQYLGSENFAKSAAVVRELGGEYVSAGKESHFVVPGKVKP
jgi:hypothetical protein